MVSTWMKSVRTKSMKWIKRTVKRAIVMMMMRTRRWHFWLEVTVTMSLMMTMMKMKLMKISNGFRIWTKSTVVVHILYRFTSQLSCAPFDVSGVMLTSTVWISFIPLLGSWSVRHISTCRNVIGILGSSNYLTMPFTMRASQPKHQDWLMDCGTIW